MPEDAGLSLICVHCGTSFVAPRTTLFCCSGCEFVYGLIHHNGLERFYEIRDANPPACPVPVQTAASTYDFCDNDEFIAKMSPDGLRMRFYLEGLNCTACLWLLEKLPAFCAAAESARINMADATIEVRRIPGGSFAAIAQTLNRFGYRPHPLRDSELSLNLQTRERRRELIRIGVAGAATGNIMILAVSLYGGAVGTLAQQFRWLAALLALPVLTYCAWPFYRSAWAALRGRRLNIDVPIVGALIAGIITSLWGLSGSHDVVYFDSLSMLVFLLLTSRFVLKNIQSRQLQATHLEDELLLGSVRRIKSDGTLEKISSLELHVGDIIRVENDDVIPADGVLVFGSGSIDRSVLTGESEAIDVEQGAAVEAGSRNVSGTWNLRVERPPAQTRLAQILRDTEKSAQTKSEFVHFADRISQAFIAVVFGVAALVLLYFISSNPQEGIARALALVIVTCPCVFGIAIPLSMSFAIRAAARHGIVIKDADAIERLWKIKALYFDKTGTLTTGEMSVLDVDVENEQDLAIALALERNQTHPVARTIVKYLRAREQPPKEIELNDVVLLAEGGVASTLNGAVVALKPLNGQNVAEPAAAFVLRASYGLFRDTTQIATFHLGDTPRPQSAEILTWARNNHFATSMISGDKRHVVSACARALGLNDSEVQAELTPENKVQALQRQAPGETMMVGDGANDAAALAAAGVGVAVCGSLEVSLRAADIYLTRPNLKLIIAIISISRQTRAAIRRNLLFSATFNVVSGILAVVGLMTPLWAAVLMPLSSLTILVSALWTGKQLASS